MVLDWCLTYLQHQGRELACRVPTALLRVWTPPHTEESEAAAHFPFCSGFLLCRSWVQGADSGRAVGPPPILWLGLWGARCPQRVLAQVAQLQSTKGTGLGLVLGLGLGLIFGLELGLGLGVG